MDDFDELAGRIEGLARAFLLLAETMERETCMDGLTLTAQLRAAGVSGCHSMGKQAAVSRTLQELGDWLDGARTRRQEQIDLFRRQGAGQAV